MLTAAEKNQLIRIIDYYLENKMKEESDNVSVFLNLAEETGDAAQVGEKYIETKHMYDLKHKLREHVEKKKDAIRDLRNKLF